MQIADFTSHSENRSRWKLFTASAIVVLMLHVRSARSESAHFWISSTTSTNGPAALNAQAFTGSLQQFGIWARPATAQSGAYHATTNPFKVLENFSLNLVTPDPAVTVTDATVTVPNPLLDATTRRFEYVNDASQGLSMTTEPQRQGGQAYPIRGLHGISFADLPLRGVGPTCYAQDNVCSTSSGVPSWLVATVSFRVTTELNAADFFLQIGNIGMNHRNEKANLTSVTFGAASDPAYIAGTYVGQPFGDREITMPTDSPDLTLQFAPLTNNGDYNHNGNLDAADYVVWRKNLNSTYTQSDYTIWRSNFGANVGSSSHLPVSENVPEPVAAGLAIVGFCCGRLLRPTRRREITFGSKATSRFAKFGGRAAIALIYLVIALFGARSANAVTEIYSLPVKNPGNPPDMRFAVEDQYHPNGIGSVAYTFNMGRTEISNSQYVDFLNNVAASDPYGLYKTQMASFTQAGIVRSGSSGQYTYSVKAPAIGMGFNGSDYTYGNKPAVLVSWFDTLRFANWLHNGQHGPGTTEYGAYTLQGNSQVPTNATTITRNPHARYWLPNEEEWYKAAYHQISVGPAQYYDYPLAAPVVPNNNRPPQNNDRTANFFGPTDFSLGSFDYPLVDVDAYSTRTHYHMLGMAGNVAEWNETTPLYWEGIGPPVIRGLRGGSWTDGLATLHANQSQAFRQSTPDFNIGFRIASQGRLDPLVRPGRLFDVTGSNLVGQRSSASSGGLTGQGVWNNGGVSVGWNVAFNSQTHQYDYEYRLTPSTPGASGHWILELDSGDTDWLQKFSLASNQWSGVSNFSIGTFQPGAENPGMPTAVSGVRLDFTGESVITFSHLDGPVWGDFYATDGTNAAWNNLFGQGTFGKNELGFPANWIARPHGLSLLSTGYLAGDMNDDHTVNQQDAPLFALALRDPDAYSNQLRPNGRCLCMDPEDAGDMNRDGRFDVDDVASFKRTLSFGPIFFGAAVEGANSSESAPEPAAPLAAIAGIAGLFVRHRADHRFAEFRTKRSASICNLK